MLSKADPILSVIVPTYNASPYIRQAAQSVLTQSLGDLELIFVDDVSTDDTRAICQQIAKTDTRIHLIGLDRNGGPGRARNRGLDIARGKYVTFLDADDRVCPDAYRNMVATANKYGADIVRGAMGDFFSDSEKPESVAKVPPFTEKHVIVSEPARLRLMALQTFAPPLRDDENLYFGGSVCNAIFRREMIEEANIRFTETPHAMSEDYLFSFSALLAAKKAVIVPNLVYNYRKVPTSRCKLPRLDTLDRSLHSAEVMDSMIAEAGFPSQARLYAMRFAIDITRAFTKVILLSSLSEIEKKGWFERSIHHPMLRRCHENFPVEQLSFMHRAAFRAFTDGNYRMTMLLLRLRELLRQFHNK